MVVQGVYLHLNHGLVAQLLLVCLLEVEAAVVQGLVVVLLEHLGEQRLHLLLHLAPLLVLLVQACQHHLDGNTWILLQQVYNLCTRVPYAGHQTVLRKSEAICDLAPPTTAISQSVTTSGWQGTSLMLMTFSKYRPIPHLLQCGWSIKQV